MKIETSRFGTLDLDVSTFIHFPWGIPGFESLKRYVLLEHRQGPFKWLQAVDHPDVAFLVCSPDVFGVHYHVPEKRASMLNLNDPQDLAILILISVDNNTRAVRPHVWAPLLLNASNRLAHQWVIEASEKRYVIAASEPQPSQDK